jgi:indole-3-glycerol phosphate synthase
MDILKEIIAHKKLEVVRRKEIFPISNLEKELLFNQQRPSMSVSLLDPLKTGIIAEYKRQSPSKGIINDHSTVEEVTEAYTRYGASGISVLTDQKFFGGNIGDLQAAIVNQIALLRKDFIIDEYQIIEAKAFGASVVLLIAACLSVDEVNRLSSTAKQLGLEVLLEIHNEEELNHVCDAVDMVGINNRNLKNFEVSIENSLKLYSQLPKDKLAIAESGISDIVTIHTLKQAGFNGFLIGEKFMSDKNPAKAFEEFVKEIQIRLL